MNSPIDDTPSYQEDTLVLESAIAASTGAIRLANFMPIRSGAHSSCVRIITGLAGRRVEDALAGRNTALAGHFARDRPYPDRWPDCRAADEPTEDGGQRHDWDKSDAAKALPVPFGADRMPLCPYSGRDLTVRSTSA